MEPSRETDEVMVRRKIPSAQDPARSERAGCEYFDDFDIPGDVERAERARNYF